MSEIVFSKAVGSGNDFIIMDNRGGKLNDLIKDFCVFTKDVCRRKESIGADGVLVLEDSAKADLKMRIINPDGSEVSMCGNGARCAALYAVKEQWCSGRFKIETCAGILEAEAKGDSVKLKMTDPLGIVLGKDLGVGNTFMKAYIIDTGVPHVVRFVEGLKDYPVKDMGAKIRYHSAFQPDGTNANFVSVEDKDIIKVRTYERGVEDETLACGTGSVASAIISHFINDTKIPVKVITASGEILKVYFTVTGKKVHDVYLEGKARILYKGNIQL